MCGGNQETAEDVEFSFVQARQHKTYDSELFELAVAKNAVKNLEKVGLHRNSRLALKDPLVGEYVDEDGNFVFEEDFLEEFVLTQQLLSVTPLKRDSVVNSRKEPPTSFKTDEVSHSFECDDIEKRFSIEKFNGKQNAKDWLDDFTTECSGHNFDDDEKKSDAWSYSCRKGLWIGIKLVP